MILITQEKALQTFNSIKEKIDVATKELMAIEKVTSENISNVLAIAKDSNKLLKEIDNRRKEIKQPYLDACKVIDETAKYLSADLEKAIKQVKLNIAEYEAEIKRKEAEERKRIEEQKQKELEELNKKAQIIDNLYKELDEFLTKAYEGIYQCKNEQELKIAYKKYVIEFPEKFKQIPNYEESIELIKDYGKHHKQLVLAYLSAIDIKDEKEANRVLQSMQTLYKDKLSNKYKAVSTVKEKVMEQLEEKAAEVIADSVIKSTATENYKPNYREYLDFTIHDRNAVPEEWLTVDENKVKEFMRDHAESLKEKIKLSPSGYIIYGGIKFTLKISTVLR